MNHYERNKRVGNGKGEQHDAKEEPTIYKDHYGENLTSIMATKRTQEITGRGKPL